MSSEIYQKACELTQENRIPTRHSLYQLKHFVLGKELTTQAKLQKCIREIDARKNSMKSMILGIEETKDNLSLLEIKFLTLEKKKTKSELDKEYKIIQKRKINRKKSALMDSIEEMQKKLEETEVEIQFFINAYQQLEKIEPLKRFDDPDINAELWNENFAQELQLRILLQKPLDLELVKCILALDKESSTRKEMVKILEQIQKQNLNFKNIQNIENKEN